MASIERILLAWTLGALSLGAMIIALVIAVVTLDELQEIFNDKLKSVADAVASWHRAGHQQAGQERIVSPQRSDTPEGDEIVTLTWIPQGHRVYASDPRVQLPFSHSEGLSRPTVQGEAWTMYSPSAATV